MLTGKALFNTLLAELNEMGLPGMLCGDTLQSEQTTQYNQRNKLWRI